MTESELGAIKLLEKYLEMTLRMSNDDKETKRMSDLLGMIAELKETDGSAEQVAKIMKKYEELIYV